MEAPGELEAPGEPAAAEVAGVRLALLPPSAAVHSPWAASQRKANTKNKNTRRAKPCTLSHTSMCAHHEQHQQQTRDERIYDVAPVGGMNTSGFN